MIILLKDFINKYKFNNKPFVVEIKNQLISIYNQLSTCTEVSNNDFLDIINSQNIFISIDEILNIQGCITIIIERKMIHNGGYVGHIEDVVVDEKYRKRSIGKQLIEYAINFCKENGCYKIILSCNDEVEEFYKKCGFTCKNKEMSLYF